MDFKNSCSTSEYFLLCFKMHDSKGSNRGTSTCLQLVCIFTKTVKFL